MGANDRIVRVQSVPGGDSPIDQSAVDSDATGLGPSEKAIRERVEVYGARCDRITHLASQSLPGAGAFTSQGATALPDGVTAVTWVVTYTRGASGGYPIFRPKWSNGVNTWNSIVAARRPVAAGAVARRRLFIDELDGPRPADASPLTFGIPMRVDRGATGAILIVAEGGVPATPGTIEIDLYPGTI